MVKPFEIGPDAICVYEKLYRYNKPLSRHTWILCQNCREACVSFRDFLSKAKEISGKYVSKRCHISMLKGRVAGLTDGLVIAGVLTPAEAEILCDYAYALK